MFLLIDLCRSCLSAAPRISIHLMFLLILHFKRGQTLSAYFNTSHVSINRMRCIAEIADIGNFNTSHVSINPSGVITANIRKCISIHLMFLLIEQGTEGSAASTAISIHLMFLLIDHERPA